MPQTNNLTYLQKQVPYKLHVPSLIIFAFAVFIAWAINIAPQMIPGGFASNFWLRTSLIIIADVLLLYVTFNLFKRNNIPAATLGLNLSKHLYKNIFIGVAIGIISLIILAFVLYLMVPYRFVYQPINLAYVLKESYSFLLGAVLEELMFRGFLLVVFARLLGWRLGLLIMALPFGLYHLAGGLSLIVSTTLFSFVFGLSFVLTRSLWAAIFAHATVNILLHLITGLDGGNNSLYKVLLDGSWPANYPAGLLTSVMSALTTSVLLYVIFVGKEKGKTSF